MGLSEQLSDREKKLAPLLINLIEAVINSHCKIYVPKMTSIERQRSRSRSRERDGDALARPSAAIPQPPTYPQLHATATGGASGPSIPGLASLPIFATASVSSKTKTLQKVLD